MALTFTSWTACDDANNPTLDWTDADALTGKLWWRYMEAMRQAIRERLYALAFFGAMGQWLVFKDWIDEEVERSTPILARQRGDSMAFEGYQSGRVFKWQHIIDTIMPYYVNQTEVPIAGNWHKSTIALADIPMWDRASIVVETGLDDVTYPTVLDPVPLEGRLLGEKFRKWMILHKAILDLLVWPKVTGLFSESKGLSSGANGRQRTTDDQTWWDWPSVEDDWAAKGWSAYAPGTARLRAHCEGYKDWYDYGRARASRQVLTLALADEYDECASEIDFYIWVNDNMNVSSLTFDADGEDIEQGSWWGFDLGNGPSSSATRESQRVTDAETCPPEPVDPSGGSLETQRGWYAGYDVDPLIIRRFDIETGFIFRAEVATP